MYTVVINGSISKDFPDEKAADAYAEEVKSLLGDQVIKKYQVRDLFDEDGIKITAYSIEVKPIAEVISDIKDPEEETPSIDNP